MTLQTYNYILFVIANIVCF